MSKLVVYHKGCCDGQGAAAAFYHRFPDAEFYGGVYSQDPPDVANKDVFLVDFSYPLEVIKKMLDQCSSLTIIDHHKTAIEALKDFEHPKLTKVLDLDHSGAVLTWMWCHPSTQVPMVLKYIEDRDLWRFNMPLTKVVNAYLYSLEFTPLDWQPLLYDISFNVELASIIPAGEALIRQDDLRVKSLMASERWLNIGGYVVPAVNANYFHASDLGNELSKGQHFGATYSDSKSGRTFSLRSSKDGVDVAEVAQQYGGGGHKHAAGFKVSFEVAQTFEIK